ncbi:hypothetical protein QRD25_09745 [Serratia marcescens]|uniref:hypothetical protein n=1 Tax=Serratia marcescens TaxID=615 RepID=UPI0025700B24|nr:hypothetical protein [Serratia marcescens]WJD89842.1 hypothetical protein QRD25_09745 [Serratia marcescens]
MNKAGLAPSQIASAYRHRHQAGGQHRGHHLPGGCGAGQGELPPTDTDRRFYTHEIRELERYRNLGIRDGSVPDNQGEVWNNTHTATLEDYQLGNSEALLYTQEALDAAEQQELRMLK